MAKKHLIGLRENGLLTLHEMGLLHSSTTRELTEDVMPWLFS